MNFIYVMDPMCSWCWAFSAVMDELNTAYPDSEITYLMGGLAPDSDDPMPQQLQQAIQSTWHTIERQTGTEFNHDFWTECAPRRSTYLACRAVITAETMRPGAAASMVQAIQHAYYLNARNPSNTETLSDLASELGLDQKVFTQSLHSVETEQTLQQHLQLARQLGAQGFPSLYLHQEQGAQAVALGYCNWNTLQLRIEQAVR